MLRLPTRSLSRWGIILGLFALAWANSLSPYFWGIDDYEWLDIAKSYPAGPYFDPARIRNIDVPERPEARVLLTGRPLVRALFSIEYHLFGESARFYHADNVLLHFLALLLLFQIARRLLAGGNFAFITACLFAIFPRHAESVTWISGRCDLLMGLFFFLSLYLFLLFLERGLIRYWLISILAGALALLSKETAIALAPVLLYSALRIPHSAFRTPHSAIRIPQSAPVDFAQGRLRNPHSLLARLTLVSSSRTSSGGSLFQGEPTRIFTLVRAS